MSTAPSAAARSRHRLRIVLGVSFAILLVEFIGGLASHSLALLADAGHMLTDVSAIGLSLLAIWFAARPPTAERTYGWYRMEILAAVMNGVLLFGVAALVLIEGVRRLLSPVEVASGLMMAIAVAGVAGNALSVWLLRRGQAESLNIRGAFLEVVNDLFGGVAVVIAAIVIATTGFLRADAIASLLVGLLILPRTWHLLREAVDVLLEATPKGVDIEEVRQHIRDAAGVADVHDLHIWTITSGIDVVSAHVVMNEGADPPRVLDELSACLRGDFDIEHSTFQLETHDRRRVEDTAHE